LRVRALKMILSGGDGFSPRERQQVAECSNSESGHAFISDVTLLARLRGLVRQLKRRLRKAGVDCALVDSLTQRWLAEPYAFIHNDEPDFGEGVPWPESPEIGVELDHWWMPLALTEMDWQDRLRPQFWLRRPVDEGAARELLGAADGRLERYARQCAEMAELERRGRWPVLAYAFTPSYPPEVEFVAGVLDVTVAAPSHEGHCGDSAYVRDFALANLMANVPGGTDVLSRALGERFVPSESDEAIWLWKADWQLRDVLMRRVSDTEDLVLVSQSRLAVKGTLPHDRERAKPHEPRQKRFPL
jgi:hypothetical protein